MRRFSQVGVHHRDGYEGVLGLLPPKPNRGLILIDPAYEYGSGMLLINPPWQIDQQIESELPKVLEQLDAQAPDMVSNWIRESA